MGYSYCTTIIQLPAVSLRPLFYIIRAMLGYAGIAWGALMPSPKRPKNTFLKFCLLLVVMSQCTTQSSQKSPEILTPLYPMPLKTCMDLAWDLRQYYGDRSCKILYQITNKTRKTLIVRCDQDAVGFWVRDTSPVNVDPWFCKHVERRCVWDDKVYYIYYYTKEELCSR